MEYYDIATNFHNETCSSRWQTRWPSWQGRGPPSSLHKPLSSMGAGALRVLDRDREESPSRCFFFYEKRNKLISKTKCKGIFPHSREIEVVEQHDPFQQEVVRVRLNFTFSSEMGRWEWKRLALASPWPLRGCYRATLWKMLHRAEYCRRLSVALSCC